MAVVVVAAAAAAVAGTNTNATRDLAFPLKSPDRKPLSPLGAEGFAGSALSSALRGENDPGKGQGLYRDPVRLYDLDQTCFFERLLSAERGD